MSDKEKIFNYLSANSLATGIVDFEEWLIIAAEQALRKSRIDAESFSGANLTMYWNWLLELIDDDVQRGLNPLVNVRDRTAKTFSCFNKDLIADTDPKRKRLGALCQSRPEILGVINGMDSRQYEALGCLASRLAGAENVFLTARGNEGGIDFFARIPLPGKTHVFSGGTGPLRIVGQCKKYETKVGVDKMDQFIQTLSFVRHKSPRVLSVLPNWFTTSKGPIVGWMVAHKGFQSGTLGEANNQGIVCSDSRDIAEIIAKSKEFHPNLAPQMRSLEVLNSANLILREFP